MSHTMLTGEQMKELLSDDLADGYTLSSVYEIENVLLMLKSMKEKIDFLKGLKKHRAKSIDEKIADLDERSDRLRAVVMHTMKKLDPDHNSLNFPDIGSVTRKKPIGKWQVDEEADLIAFLDDNGCKDDVVKTKETIDSRKLKKMLDDFAAARVDVPGVTHIEGNESISIRFADKSKPSEVAENQAAVTQQAEVALDALDGISADNL